MKRLLYHFLIILILITSCKKSDNPVLPDDLLRAPIPQFLVDSSADLTISGQDPASFTGRFTLNQYFTTDHAYQSFDIVVRKSGGAVKVLQANITQLPASVTITGEQLETLFGSAIEPTDYFDIGADAMLTGGQKIEAFPADGYPSYDPNIATFPNIGPVSIQYGVFCTYDAAIYKGNFVVVQDDWQDYHPGDIVPVTQIDNTHFSFEYATLDAQPIIITVDPVTNATSISNQYFGNYGPDYGNFYIHTIASGNNVVLPCQESFSVVTNIASDALGDFGNYRIVMRKQ